LTDIEASLAQASFDLSGFSTEAVVIPWRAGD